ncbi:ATP-binding protein [Belnapia rosea]|uniref:AAA domain-containing protein n=1 Tax=Belnapia rosea TaxID=938405 RepID=A0A1G7C1G9_9PROT|nr:ATP-binding protein [Belnapia rosea]SDE32536.1 AAA domain-containing protein [Belnapia rosea]
MGRSSRRRRANALSAVFVETRRVRRAFERVDDLLECGWEDTFCRALLLLGNSRAGKTQIVTHYVRLRVEEQPDPALRPRIVAVEVPAGCTLKSFAVELLAALNDPDPHHGSQAELTARIAQAVEEQEVDLVVIDEVQRLIDADTDKVKRDVANWLTGLLNKRLCPLLLVGERKAERVFQGNMHLEGRTLGEVVVTPYDWNDPEDRTEFRAVLHMIDAKPRPRGAVRLRVARHGPPDLRLRRGAAWPGGDPHRPGPRHRGAPRAPIRHP